MDVDFGSGTTYFFRVNFDTFSDLESYSGGEYGG